MEVVYYVPRNEAGSASPGDGIRAGKCPNGLICDMIHPRARVEAAGLEPAPGVLETPGREPAAPTPVLGVDLCCLDGRAATITRCLSRRARPRPDGGVLRTPAGRTEHMFGGYPRFGTACRQLRKSCPVGNTCSERELSAAANSPVEGAVDESPLFAPFSAAKIQSYRRSYRRGNPLGAPFGGVCDEKLGEFFEVQLARPFRQALLETARRGSRPRAHDQPPPEAHDRGPQQAGPDPLLHSRTRPNWPRPVSFGSARAVSRLRLPPAVAAAASCRAAASRGRRSVACHNVDKSL